MTTKPLVYRALKLLETECMPSYRGRKPFWRPTPPKVDVYAPVTSWRCADHDDVTDGQSLVDLDVNGAYIAAASNVTVAWGALTHTGPLGDASTRPLPGYYLIDRHTWPDTATIPSPLGTGLSGKLRFVWVAHPTVELLARLADAGKWPPVMVHDSWTCDRPVRLSKWAERMRDDRAYALECIRGSEPDSAERGMAEATYEAIKDGYSKACSMLLGVGEDREDPEDRTYHSEARRPDWTRAIEAMHAANLWRKLWAIHGADPDALVAVGDTDEITLTMETFTRLVQRGTIPTLDPSKVQIGALKVKRADDAGLVSLVLTDAGLR